MNINVKVKWSVTVGVIASVVVIWTTLNPWPAVGWTTPNQHNADMIEAVSEIKDFRDEWKCDEYDEEIRDMLRRQAAGDDNSDLTEDIKRLRAKMVKLDCGRFEDFG